MECELNSRPGLGSQSHYFFPFFLPPLFAPAPAPLLGASTTAAPWDAPPPPPPPLRFFPMPWPNVDRSLFFNHRSGSGAGVTPGVTPLGTREGLAFFGLEIPSALASCGPEAAAATAIAAADGAVGAAGGGLVSSDDVMAVGRADNDRR